MRNAKVLFALVVAVLSALSLRAQGTIVPGPSDVVVEDLFVIEMTLSVDLPGRVGGLGDFFDAQIDFRTVSFREGYLDYGGVPLDLDEVEFDLNFTKLCAQLVLAGDLGLLQGQLCDADPGRHLAGELLSVDLAEDYAPESSFSWVSGSKLAMALELPAWADEPATFPSGRALLTGEATVGNVQPEAGTVDLVWEGVVWMSRVYRRGDANDDGTVNIADPVFTLMHLFLDEAQAPGCHDAADVDGDGDVELTDAIYELNYLFLRGPPLAVPGTGACGPPIPDPERPLDCRRFTSCF